MSRTMMTRRLGLDLSLDRALVPAGAGAAERLLPDPEWPVPPRGWHLWAAALPEPRGAQPSSVDGDHATSDDHERADVDLTGDDETRPFVEADDAAFTLPSRPALAPRDTVDLLAGPRRRRLPEGSGLGFTLMAALVVLGTLIGGPTGGLVVLGVSTLLAASAAIVLGRLTLNHVGGLRGGSLLLVVAVGALIVGSVDAAARREDAVQRGVPVPVSSPIASADVSTPKAGASTTVAPASGRMSTELSAVPSVTGTVAPPSPRGDVETSAPVPRSSTASATTAPAHGARAAARPAAPILPSDAFAPKPDLGGLAAVAGSGDLPTGVTGPVGTAPVKPVAPATPVVPVKPAKPATPGVAKDAKATAKAAKAEAKSAAKAARAEAKSAAKAAKATTKAAKAEAKGTVRAARTTR